MIDRQEAISSRNKSPGFAEALRHCKFFSNEMDDQRCDGGL